MAKRCVQDIYFIKDISTMAKRFVQDIYFIKDI